MPDQPENTPDLVIPEDLTALTRDELFALESQLIDRANALGESSDAEQVAELVRISQTLPKVGAQIDVVDKAAAETQAARSAVEQYQRRPAEPQATTPDGTPGPDAEQPRGDQPAEGDQGGDTPTEVPGEVESVTDAVPVAASTVVATRGRSIAEIAQRAPRGRIPTSGNGNDGTWFRSLTAGAEIPGVTASSQFESAEQFRQALLNRTQALTHSGERSASTVVAHAHIPELTQESGNFITSADSASAVSYKMLEAIQTWLVGEGERRARESVVADTGFCAPAETIYDLCDPYVADGMVSLPEIGITRGGIRWFPMPDLACFTNYSWEYGPDELECMNKPCLEIPCPEPTEVNPGVIGACLTGSILQTRAFPELIDRYMKGLMTSHLMLISKRTLQQMVAGSDPVIYDDALLDGRGFTSSLLASMEFQSEDLREDYLLAESETLDVQMPRWVKAAIRIDLADRTGVDMLNISDSYINGLFTQRGFNPNWIKGWQNEAVGAPGAQRAFPTTVQYLIYRSGAWVRGLEPIIELENVYDSVMFKKNQFTRLFTEQAIMLANMCTKSRAVTLPVCPNGSTSAPQVTACFSEPPVVGTIVCPANVVCPTVPCCDGTTVPVVTSLAVAPATATVQIGETQQLTATATMFDGTTQNVSATASYQSSNTNIATVSDTGLVTAVGAGQAVITATYGSGGRIVTAASAITVPTVTALSVTPETANLAVDGTQQVTATATLGDGSTDDVTAVATYQSSDTAIATVSAAGLITAHAAGTATVTATYAGRSDTTTVTVA